MDDREIFVPRRVQTADGAHPSGCSRLKRPAREADHSLHLIARLRTSGATSPYSLYRRDAVPYPSAPQSTAVTVPTASCTPAICAFCPHGVYSVCSGVCSRSRSTFRLRFLLICAPPSAYGHQIPSQCLCQNSRPPSPAVHFARIAPRLESSIVYEQSKL